MFISLPFLMVCIFAAAVGDEIKTGKECKCARKVKICKNGEKPTFTGNGAACSDWSKPRCPVNKCTRGNAMENKKKCTKCPRRKKICADGKKPKLKKKKSRCKDGSQPRCPYKRCFSIKTKTTTTKPQSLTDQAVTWNVFASRTYVPSPTTSKPLEPIRMHTLFDETADIDVSTVRSCSDVGVLTCTGVRFNTDWLPFFDEGGKFKLLDGLNFTMELQSSKTEDGGRTNNYWFLVDGREDPRLMSVRLMEEAKREPIVFGNFQANWGPIYFVESCGVDCTVLITRKHMEEAPPVEFPTEKYIDPFDHPLEVTQTETQPSTSIHIDPFPSSFPTLSEPDLPTGRLTNPPLEVTRTETEPSTSIHIDPFPSSIPTQSEPDPPTKRLTNPPLLEVTRTETEPSTSIHIDLFPSSFPIPSEQSEPELQTGKITIPPLLEVTQTRTEPSTSMHVDIFPNPLPTLPEPELVPGLPTNLEVLQEEVPERSVWPTNSELFEEEVTKRTHVDPYSKYYNALFKERQDIDVSETRQCLQDGVVACTGVRLNTNLLQSLKEGQVVMMLPGKNITMELQRFDLSKTTRSTTYHFILSTGASEIMIVGQNEDPEKEPSLYATFRPGGKWMYFVESCGEDCTVILTRHSNYFDQFED